MTTLSYKLLGQDKVVLPKGLYKVAIGATVDYFSIKILKENKT